MKQSLQHMWRHARLSNERCPVTGQKIAFKTPSGIQNRICKGYSGQLVHDYAEARWVIRELCFLLYR